MATWKEVKDRIEDLGIKDDTVIWFIDLLWPIPSNMIAYEHENDYGKTGAWAIDEEG